MSERLQLLGVVSRIINVQHVPQAHAHHNSVGSHICPGPACQRMRFRLSLPTGVDPQFFCLRTWLRYPSENLHSPIAKQPCQIGNIRCPLECGSDVVGQHVLKILMSIHNLLCSCSQPRTPSVTSSMFNSSKASFSHGAKHS